MEAKEKAVELVKKFDDFTVVWIEEETCYRSPKKAKQGALIVVEEMLKTYFSNYKDREWWLEVKAEIEMF